MSARLSRSLRQIGGIDMNDFGSSSAVATRITILVDNEVRPKMGLVAEHGFSAMVERGFQRLLFDTGQGRALMHNANTLGMDLAGLISVILSHGHYDHTGGLSQVVNANPGIRVVAHPGIFGRHLKLDDDGRSAHDVGNPHSLETLQDTGARVELPLGFTEIVDGVWFSGEVPRKPGGEPDSVLVVESAEGYVPDPLPDDAYLLLDTPSGPALLLGCAHAGLDNIFDHLELMSGLKKLHAVIGGTHLGPKGDKEVAEAIKCFEKFHVDIVAPCHCTGPERTRELKERFGDKFREAWAGAVFEF